MADKELLRPTTPEENKSWVERLRDFSQDTTLHGVRYLGVISNHIVRRAVWLLAILGSLALFIYVNVENINKLISHPRAVNVEVTYQESLRFPAVTICNQNLFRITQMFRYGIYDEMVYHFDQDSIKEVLNGDRYTFLDGKCDDPHSAVAGSVWAQIYKNVTLLGCEYLCSGQHTAVCSTAVYNRRRLTCYLMSDHLWPMPTSTSLACKNADIEWYLRTRYISQNAMVTCSFEDKEDCPLEKTEVDAKMREKWQLVMAGKYVPKSDHTSNSALGSFLHLSRTSNRHGYESSLRTTFMHFEDMCIELFYAQTGVIVIPFSINAVGEDLRRQLIFKTPKTTNQTTYVESAIPEWKRLFTRLPRGTYQLELYTVRPAQCVNAGWSGECETSGMAIDDVLVWPCAKFDSNCKRFEDGSDYHGRTEEAPAHTRRTMTCSPWSEVIHDSLEKQVTFLPSATANYCRNLGRDTRGPGCYIKEKGFYQYAYCEIPYCECGKDYFKCSSGQCISSELQCNGAADCTDGTDEIVNCNKNRRIPCDFETRFMCGYTSDTAGRADWKRRVLRQMTDPTDPPTDYYGSTDGSVVSLVADRGLEGDTAKFETPTFDDDTVTTVQKCLVFHLYKFRLSRDTNARLSIYIDNTDKKQLLLWRDETDFATSGDPARTWTEERVPIPAGTAKLYFVGVVGVYQRSGLAIDNVSLMDSDACTATSTINVAEGAEEESSTPADHNDGSCSFVSGDLCGYTFHSSNVQYGWNLIPEAFVDAFVNATSSDSEALSLWTTNFWSSSGFFETPNYPDEYPLSEGGLNEYVIHAPEGAEITIEFLNFHLEDCPDPPGDFYYDYMIVKEVDTETTPNTKKYCGKLEPFTVSLTATKVVVEFWYDGVYSYTGFKATYVISNVPNTDYRPVVGGILITSQWAWVTSTLISPELNLDEVHCLSTSISESRGDFHVRLLYKDESTEDIWHVEYIKESPPISRKIEIKLPNGQYQVQLVAVYQSYPGIAMLLDPITISRGNCLSKDVISYSELACDFNVDSDCKYVDVSFTAERWTYSHYSTVENPDDFTDTLTEINGTSVSPRVALMCDQNRKRVTCLLASHLVETTRKFCMQITFSFSTPTCKITIAQEMDEGEIADMGSIMSDFPNGDLIKVDSWHTGQVELPAGRYRLLIGATDLVRFARIFIGQISVYRGGCVDSDGVRSATISPHGSLHDPAPIPTITTVQAEPAVTTPEPSYWTANPISDDLQWNSIAGRLSIKDVYDYTAHDINDMISSCTWDGQTCNINEMFVPEYANAGLCYTFNSGSMDDLLNSTRTGAQFGLRLTLNVEQYESTPGSGIDAGVRVHLHYQDDVPAVKDTGIAIPITSHTLISVKYSKTRTLPDPYTKCTPEETHLSYYPANNYTVARCKRICDMERIVALCRCRMPYMPGNASVCSMEQYLNCILEAQENSTNTCEDCTDACAVNAYSTQSSFASFADSRLRNLLPADMSHFRRRYHDSVNVRARAEPTELSSTVKTVNGIRPMISNLRLLVAQHASMGELSAFTYGTHALQNLVEFVTADIRTAFANLPTYVHEYQDGYGRRRNHLMTLLSDLAENAGSLLALTVERKRTTNQKQRALDALIGQMSYQTQLALVSLNSLNYSGLYQYQTTRQYLTKLPSRIHANREVDQKCLKTRRDLIQLLELMNETYGDEQLLLTEVDQLFPYFYDLSKTIAQLDTCTNEYWAVLELAQNFVQTNRFAKNETRTLTKYFAKFDYNGSSSDLRELEAHFKTLEQQLANDTVSKLDIGHDTDGSVKYEDLKSLIDKVEDGIEDEHHKKLKALIESTKEATKEAYISALQHIQRIESHFDSVTQRAFFTNLVRNFTVWRQPFVNSDSYKIVHFNYDVTEGSFEVWPASKSLQDFFKNYAAGALDQLLEYYFEPVQNMMDDANDEIGETGENLEEHLKELQETFKTYHNMHTTETKIIQNNLLRLDIYYGELKYEYIEQTPSYTIVNFFSEFGGYMGLLMGSSVLTICELIDFIIFTALNKVKNRRIRPSSSSSSSSSSSHKNSNESKKPSTPIIQVQTK